MAKSRVKGILVEIGGDTSALEKALSNVNSSTASLSKELKGVNSLLKLDPKNTELVKQKQDLLKDSIEQTSKKLEELKKAQEMANETIANGGEISQEGYRNLQREIINTENKLNSLKVEASNWTKAGRSIEEFGNKVSNISSKIDKLGTTLTTRLTLPIVGLATAMVNASKEFETAFTGVEKTVDGTVEQMEELKQGIKDMSKEIPSTTTEISAVAEAAGQLGIKTENILDFTRTMIDLGNSTNLSADEAATAIAQLYNVMGSDINTVSKFGSALVDLGNNAATTESDILNMATRIASSGKQVGLTEQQVLSLATTLSSVGLEAEGGGSAISTVITTIDKAVALNSETLKTWAQTAGMSTKQFKTAWETDTMSAIQAVIKGMGDASAGGENLNVILDELGITSIRQTDTMKRLSSASELLGEMVEISNNAWEENTALTNEANKRYQTLDSRLQTTKNKIVDMATNMGNKLTPKVNKLLDGVDGLIDKFDNLSDEEIDNIINIGKFVIAIGPAIKIVGTLGKGIGTVSKGIGTFSQAIAVAKNNTTSTSESVNKLAGVFNFLKSPVGLATTSITLLTVSLIAIEKQISKNVEKAKEMKESIEEQIQKRQQLREEQEKQIASNIAEIDNTQNLYDELKQITDENGKIKDGYEKRAEFITTQLSKALGIEIEINEGVIQSYQDIQKEIDKTIAKKKAEIYLQMQEENYKTALQERATAYEKLVELESQLEEAQQRVLEAQEKINKSGGITKVFATEELKSAQAEIQNLNTAIEEQKGLISDYTEDVKLYDTNVALMAENSTESFNKVIDNSIAKITEQKVVLDGTLNEQITTLREHVNKTKELMKVAIQNQDETNKKAYENQVKADEEQLTELGIQLAKMTGKVEELTPDQIEAWKNLADTSKTAFNESIQYVSEDTQKELIKTLGIVQDSQLPDYFGTIGNLSEKDYNSNINNINSDTDSLLKKVSQHVKDDTSVKEATGELGEEADEGFNDKINPLQWGTDIVKLITQGMTGGNSFSLISKAAEKVGGWISSYLHFSLPEKGPLSDMDKSMPDMINLMTKGIDNNKSKLIKSTNNMAREIQNTLNFPQIHDFGKLQGKLSNKIIDSTKTVYTTPQIVFNVQELDESKLQQCFDYINRKFGSSY